MTGLLESGDTKDAEMSSVLWHSWQRLVEVSPDVDVSRVARGETWLDEWAWHLRWDLEPLEGLCVQHPVVDESLESVSTVDLSSGHQDSIGNRVKSALLSWNWHSTLWVGSDVLRSDVLWVVQVEEMDTGVVEVSIWSRREEDDVSVVEESVVEMVEVRSGNLELRHWWLGGFSHAVDAPDLKSWIGHHHNLWLVLAHRANVFSSNGQRLWDQRANVGN